MKTLVCLLEEPSAKEMLKVVLPKILPDEIGLKFIVFEGKQDLEKQIKRKLRSWLAPDSYFLVMRDQDSGDCHTVKNGLIEKVEQAGKTGSSLIRIACRELESFYLGDLVAVEQGLELSGIANEQQNRKFRTPDDLANPAEELLKITQKQYQKISGSRAIAPHLKLDRTNRSTSFNILLDGVLNLINRN
jgi:ribosomal protein S19